MYYKITSSFVDDAWVLDFGILFIPDSKVLAAQAYGCPIKAVID